MAAERISVGSLKRAAQHGTEDQQRAALYWLQRLLDPEAVEFVLESHHISASERTISRVTWLFHDIESYGLIPSDEFMQRLRECAYLLEQHRFVRNWVPHEDWVVGASRWGYSDALSYWDETYSTGRICLNLAWGSDASAVIGALDASVPVDRERSVSDVPPTDLAANVEVLQGFPLKTLELALGEVGEASTAHSLIQAEITRRRVLLHHDIALISEQNDELVRRVRQSLSQCPRTSLRGFLALASVGDSRIQSLPQAIEQGHLSPSDVPVAIRAAVDAVV